MGVHLCVWHEPIRWSSCVLPRAYCRDNSRRRVEGKAMPAKLPHHDADEESLKEVRAVYAELEKRPVQRDCIRRTECCQFKLTGVMPLVTKGERVSKGIVFLFTVM